MTIKPRQVIASLAIWFGAALIAGAGVAYVAPLASIETKLADIRIAAMQAPLPPSKDIAVVALDEATLANFVYRSPVDRAFLATLIKQIEAKGAAAIGLDVILDQPTEPAKDQALKDALRTAKVPLAVSFSSAPNIVNQDQLAYMQDFVPVGMRMEANLLTDPYDGLVRRLNPGGEMVGGKRVDTPLHPAGFARKMVTLVGGRAPLEPMDIAWRARPDAENPPFPQFSASYAAALPDELIKGRIVLIGAVQSMTDRHLTPLSIIDDGDQGNMPGVMVQANAISQILEGRRPPRAQPGMTIALLGLFALLGVGISWSRKGITFNVVLAAILLAAYWVGGIVGFGHGLPMLPLFGPSVALMLALWMMDLFIGRGERKQRQFIQGAFSRYVSPAVVDQLVESATGATISGTKQEATFLFTDVAGFTTLSEQLTAEQLSEVLNAYLEGACQIILEHRGTIDKFIGDAIMAIFNAPLPQADHAARAVRCALDLDAYAEEFRTARNAQDIPIGITRIGVHCGPAVVGNFGSQARMDFTALGDTVNTAARTEGVNKYFGTRIACTAQAVEHCSDLSFRPIGDIVLKGKTQGTVLYTPVASTDPAPLLAGYAAAYALLSDEKAEAAGAFAALAQEFPTDPLVAFHLKRINGGLLSNRVVMDDK